MRQEMSMVQKQTLGLTLGPRMIQSMEILQMPLMALLEKVETELQENPVLELATDMDDPTPAESGDWGENGPPPEINSPEDALVLEAEGEELRIDQEDGSADFDRLDRLTSMSGDWAEAIGDSKPSRGAVEQASDRQHDMMQNISARIPSLQDHLAEQITFLNLAPEDEALLRYLVSFVDPTGYLRTPLLELAVSYIPPITDPGILEVVLEMLQKLEPKGVGAQNLAECLVLQIPRKEPDADLMRILITQHLEDIRHNRLPLIHKKTGFELGAIQRAIGKISHLNPRPGAGFDNSPNQYVVPDLFVEANDQGEYQVRLTDGGIPEIRINPMWREAVRDPDTDPKTREYLKRKIQSALWLEEAIQQRRSTIKRVAESIIRRQRRFLEEGPDFIEPLKMQQVADEVGVHVTTVSRAVDDKFVQTPRGIFPLKRFFTGGTTTSSGEEIAWEKLKKRLQELVADENKSSPLSDDDLVQKMTAEGFPIARRTITKYRKMLHIPSSRQRRIWLENPPSP